MDVKIQLTIISYVAGALADTVGGMATDRTAAAFVSLAVARAEHGLLIHHYEGDYEEQEAGDFAKLYAEGLARRANLR